jgi:adenine-specific DNA-methyltransferase
MTHAITIGAGTSRSRSPHGERRPPSPEARDHARMAIPPRLSSAGHIVQGDCIEQMRAMQSQSVDFILTDPPYITRYRERSGRRVANDDNADWLRPAFAEMYRVLARDSFCVSFYGWNKADLFIAAWRAAGFRMVGHIVFRKGYASSVRFLRYEHETAYLLAKGEVVPPASPVPDVLDWSYTGNRLHPTQKPVSVLKPLIEAFCKPGGVVLDPFCGSGSTLVAARDVGRDYIGIELDSTYHRTASARLHRGNPEPQGQYDARGRSAAECRRMSANRGTRDQRRALAWDGVLVSK